VRARDFLKRLDLALKNVNGEIGEFSKHSRIASGLSTEGYAGGYAQALRDVEAMLRHGHPNDPRGYWRRDK
jgi:hypothetical protein